MDTAVLNIKTYFLSFADRFKACFFFLSRQLWPRIAPVLADEQGNLNWPKLIIGFCFSAAGALLPGQIHPQPTLTFHLFSQAVVFAFAPLFVARFIGERHQYVARELEEVGVFSAATAFFLCITIPLPLILKLITWAVYGLSLLAIFIANISS
ncbi:hypothetical protein Patl1_18979 [Pistacia atlantica]|uniref:Uncharacterized protein n=1 Tax=Pistacia atlantica TaxID=434234 RepID=A0ACC1C1V0_9ROSI|nr:hypothetical protein Patl1_18979 [Pistacia atlantica]